ncbi:MAG: hypothetical protein J6A63_10305 [Clostridia bacterium]|nr:hypothetical protein [Clostridia bacterium]
MRVRNIVCAFLSALLILPCFAACGGTTSSSGTDVAENEKLIADFETFRSCTENVVYANHFGRFEHNTDKTYVTSGNASIKINAMGDRYMSSAQPNMQIRLQDDERDLTKLKRVTADFYNATDEDYEIGIFFKIGTSVQSDTPVTKILLEKNKWTKVSKQMDIAVMSLCNDMTNVNSVCFTFETCYDTAQKKDVYIDNVRFEYSDETPQSVEMTLDENEFCSFDKLYQKEVFTENFYAVMPDYGFELSLNNDLRYSKKGKSLKMYVPACPDGATWGWPNVQFAENLVKAVNMSRFDGNDEFSFWIYNASDKNVYLSLDFWRSYNKGKRAFTHMLYAGWNNIRMTLDKINEEDGGLDLLTDGMTMLRICVFPVSGDPVELYLDSMEIIVHENQA